jgi:hypothetical protein
MDLRIRHGARTLFTASDACWSMARIHPEMFSNVA